MKSLVTLLLLNLLLSACGTIGGRKNIVPFDSNPRGLLVYDQRGKLLGKTPFFYDIKPKHQQYFIFKVPESEGNWSSRELYKCPIDWGQSLVPGVVPAFFGIGGAILGGASLAIDAISGHLFLCQGPIFVGRDLLPKTTLKEKNVLVLPFFDKDVKVSKLVRQYWLDNYFSRVKTEDKIIDLDKSYKLMEFRGITNQSASSFSEVKKENLNKIASELNATHSLLLKRGKNKNRHKIKPVLYDLFTGQEENTEYLNEFDLPKEATVERSYIDTLIGIINLVPNTLTFTYLTNPKVYYNADQFSVSSANSQDTDEHPEAVPRIVTFFGLANVLHPQFYGSWDWDFTTFPMFKLNAWQTQNDNFTTQMIAFMATYNIGLTGHTPWGALSLEAGYGMGNLNMQDSLGMSENKVKRSKRFNLNYVGFFDEKWYFVASLTQYEINSPVGRPGYYELEKWIQSSFGFGYYFPSLKTMIRDWFRY
jgi:hypothetical protein